MCTLERQGDLFVLTSTGEHRFNPTVIDYIKAALRKIKSQSTSSSTALITTAHGKFFSNGYNLAWAKYSSFTYCARLMSVKFRSLVADLISLPMPTIAAVNGHALAAGFIFALCHDYVLMRKDRGYLYMSELDIGFKIPVWFNVILWCKIESPMARRDITLRAAKIKAENAVENGVIDSAHDSAEATVESAVRLTNEMVRRKWEGRVYYEIRKDLMAQVLDAVKVDETVGEVGTKTCRL